MIKFIIKNLPLDFLTELQQKWKKTSKFASPKEMSHGFPGGFPMDFPWIWVPRLLQRLVEELPETARLHTEAVLQLIGQILEEDGRKTPTWLVGG